MGRGQLKKAHIYNNLPQRLTVYDFTAVPLTEECDVKLSLKRMWKKVYEKILLPFQCKISFRLLTCLDYTSLTGTMN